MTAPFEYVFPAIRGVQAGREYYVSMCPLRLIPKIFLFNEEELVPELRAQRHLNRSRIPEMARYLTDNTQDYVFSALTASIDAAVKFEPFENESVHGRVGTLHVPMTAQFVINDGQHRRAAIEVAIAEQPDLADESIAVVFFLDQGLERCQQMFADLNRYAVRPSRSLGVLYDHRDDRADLAREVVLKSDFFRDIIELERNNLSPRSRRLFTFSALYGATAALLEDTNLEDPDERAVLARRYWETVAEQFPAWDKVREGELSAGEVRQDYVHAHGVALHALGRVGHALMAKNSDAWATPLQKLQKIDWRRTNTKLWEGRALANGRMSKAQSNLVLTANAIKQVLKLPLTKDEQIAETEFKGYVHAQAAE